MVPFIYKDTGVPVGADVIVWDSSILKWRCMLCGWKPEHAPQAEGPFPRERKWDFMVSQ